FFIRRLSNPRNPFGIVCNLECWLMFRVMTTQDGKRGSVSGLHPVNFEWSASRSARDSRTVDIEVIRPHIAKVFKGAHRNSLRLSLRHPRKPKRAFRH